MSRARATFLALWTLAVAATVSAFVLHLALRGRVVQLGYELGRARQDQSRLREEIVARTLLGMEPPPPDRIVALPPLVPGVDDGRPRPAEPATARELAASNAGSP